MGDMLLVHGAFHGAWCWDRLLPALAARGIEATTVELPFTDSVEDAAAVAEVLDTLDAPVVVGHSFGGIVMSAAAGGAGGHRPARHLVFLTALMVDPDETPDLGGAPGVAAIRYEGDSASIDPAGATGAFYHRSDPALAEWATAQLRPQPLASLAGPRTGAPAWRTVPSTYIVCTDDQIISPDAQRRMAKNAGSVREIDSDHSPFLYDPEGLADLLVEIADSAG